MRRITAIIAATALLAAATPSLAGGGYGYYHGYKRHHYGYGGHYRHRHYHRHGGGKGALLLFGGLAGGLVLGTLLSRPRYVVQPAPSVTYVSPPPPVSSNCRQTTGTGLLNGRPAVFGGTWCSDAFGRSYIVNDSVRFLYYIQ